MTIDNFFTWELLATFAGCTAATIIVTELLKKFITKLNPQIISFLVSLIILVVGQLVAKKFAWSDIALDLINAVVISFAANGGFDCIKSVFNPEDQDLAGTIILDKTEPGNSYISFKSDPANLADGEELKLDVKTVHMNK